MTAADWGIYLFSKVWAWILLIACNLIGAGRMDHTTGRECALCGSSGPSHFPDCQYIALQKYVREG